MWRFQLLFFFRKGKERGTLVRATAIVLFCTGRALYEKNMTVIVGAIHVYIGRVPALVTMCYDIITDPFTQTLVENEIDPQKFVFQTTCPHLPVVLNDTTFQLENIVETSVLHVGTRFFTANTTGTVHENIFVLVLFQHFSHHRQFFPEGDCVRDDGIFKTPHLAS